MTTTLGYTIFYVNDVGATVAFFHEAFGLEPKFITDEGDYGEPATGSTTLAFASIALAMDGLGSAGGFTPSEPNQPPQGASITLVSDEFDTLFTQALAAGATRYVDPSDKPWGQTVAYVRDANGILIELATPLD
jgi:lactoylglutathione lyase